MKYLLTIQILLVMVLGAKAQILSGGPGHTLLVCKNGEVYGIGINFRGAVGNSTNDTAFTFQQALQVDSVSQVSTGLWHSLALREDSTVWSWGGNDQGALINGNYSDSWVPQKVDSLEKVIQISAGFQHNLFIREDSTVWGGGSNNFGELGHPTSDYNFTKVVTIPGLSNITQIAAGYDFSLVLHEDSTIWSFGLNSIGQLGLGDFKSRKSPTQITSLDSVVKIVAGPTQAYAIKSNGDVWAWGQNRFGELGDGSPSGVGKYSTIPVKVPITDVVELAAGTGFTVLALKKDGTVWGWGNNSAGQIGDGTRTNRPTPVKVDQLNGIAHIAIASESIAIDSNGVIYTWGRLPYLFLDSSTYVLSPKILSPAPCNPIISLPEVNTPEEIELEIYPNPGSGVFYIEANEAVEKISVFNSRGELVLEQRGPTGAVDISNQPEGLYFMQLETKAGYVVEKLLKQ